MDSVVTKPIHFHFIGLVVRLGLPTRLIPCSLFAHAGHRVRDKKKSDVTKVLRSSVTPRVWASCCPAKRDIAVDACGR